MLTESTSIDADGLIVLLLYLWKLIFTLYSFFASKHTGGVAIANLESENTRS